MPGGLPGVQRQHQPTLWKLRKRRLLSDFGDLLQRDMHGFEFRSCQLRRLRIRLRCIDPELRPRDLLRLPAGHRLYVGQRKLRRVRHCLPGADCLLGGRL